MKSSSATGTRRRSREMALQLLFQNEFVPADVSPEEVLRRFVDDFAVDREVAEYGGKLFLGTVTNKKEIDSVIQAHSAHWKVSRMGLVDLSVMRIAVFEMKYLNPPLSPGIAIDEAVEVAKKFGSTESGAFVNGILDQVARSL